MSKAQQRANAPSAQELNQVFGGEEEPIEEMGAPGLDDMDEIDGLPTVPMGEQVSSFPISRFKGHSGIVSRIGILLPKAGTASVHFVEGFRPFHCFHGICCRKLKYPPVRYIVPIIVYNTDSNARIVSKNFDISYLSLGQERYAYFANYIKAGGRPNYKDFIVTCQDDHYQKLVFSEAPGEALWRKYPDLNAEVRAAWKDKKGFLRAAIACDLSEQEFIEMFGGGVATPATAQDDPFADVPLDEALGF
jgi:hypothetical protein